jgi:hypothetical protein
LKEQPRFVASFARFSVAAVVAFAYPALSSGRSTYRFSRFSQLTFSKSFVGFFAVFSATFVAAIRLSADRLPACFAGRSS